MDKKQTIFSKYKVETLGLLLSLVSLSIAFLMYLNSEPKTNIAPPVDSYPNLTSQEDFDLVLGQNHKIGDKFEVEITLNEKTYDTCEEFLCIGYIEIKDSNTFRKLEGSEINLTGKNNIFSFFEKKEINPEPQRVVIDVYNEDLQIIASYQKEI